LEPRPLARFAVFAAESTNTTRVQGCHERRAHPSPDQGGRVRCRCRFNVCGIHGGSKLLMDMTRTANDGLEGEFLAWPAQKDPGAGIKRENRNFVILGNR